MIYPHQAPHQGRRAEQDLPTVLHPDAPLTELQLRLSRALAQPQFRLAFRIAADLDLPESLVQEVLAAVPRLSAVIDSEKEAETLEVREAYQGEIQRSRPRAAHQLSNSPRRNETRSTDFIPLTEL